MIEQVIVSVPTGDFSFIYQLTLIATRLKNGFPSPPGTFLLSIVNSSFFHFLCNFVSVPTGDFSFIYPVFGTP